MIMVYLIRTGFFYDASLFVIQCFLFFLLHIFDGQRPPIGVVPTHYAVRYTRCGNVMCAISQKSNQHQIYVYSTLLGGSPAFLLPSTARFASGLTASYQPTAKTLRFAPVTADLWGYYFSCV